MIADTTPDLGPLHQALKRLDSVELETFCNVHHPEIAEKFSYGMRQDARILLVLDEGRRRPEIVDPMVARLADWENQPAEVRRPPAVLYRQAQPLLDSPQVRLEVGNIHDIDQSNITIVAGDLRLELSREAIGAFQGLQFGQGAEERERQYLTRIQLGENYVPLAAGYLPLAGRN